MSANMYDDVVNSYGDKRKQDQGYKSPPAKRRLQTPANQRSQPPSQQIVNILPEDDASKVKHDFSFGGAFRLGLGAGIGLLFAIPAAIILTILVLSALGLTLSSLVS
ncbi:MAG: hypothetical protein OXE52_18455 [Chloroflexi bacterium]|nr:hypothetical protein [Chloroflexota bacterium]